MGSYASTQKSAQGSAMNMVSFEHKSEKLAIPESPVKALPANVGRPMKSNWSFPSSKRNSGSREEAFFDSQPWLESDCEDDFYSVNGDFTPSRGSTPAHCFSPRTSWRANSLSDNKLPGSNLAPPRPEGRKKLAELFRESIREEREDFDERGGVFSRSTPYVSVVNSVCSGEESANGEVMMENEKPIKGRQGCFPSLVSCRSFSCRKSRMSPPLPVNGKR